jgi:hypothetical protein
MRPFFITVAVALAVLWVALWLTHTNPPQPPEAIGWCLVAPPIKLMLPKFLNGLPLSRWNRVAVYNTPAECFAARERQRAAALEEYEHAPQTPAFVKPIYRLAVDAWQQALCVASNDPRLKKLRP